MSNLFNLQHKYSGALALVIAVAAILLATSYSGRDVPADDIVRESAATVDGLQVRLLHPSSSGKGAIIFLDDSTDAMASAEYPGLFAGQGYDVMVVDAGSLLSSAATGADQCIDVAARLLNIRYELAGKHHVDSQGLPIVVGSGLGAALAYIAVVQAPAHRFHAAVSINFSPRLGVQRPLCSAEQLVTSDTEGVITLAPVASLPTSWYVFQDIGGPLPLAGRDFTNPILNAKLTLRQMSDEPVVASVVQILQWLDPRLTDQLLSAERLGGLPLIEVAAEPGTSSPLLAILLTGDGGWAEIDKGIAASLARSGVPTVALDSLSYFWKRRTPEDAARDMDAVIADYLVKWRKERVILIGYSFGADVLPVIANRLGENNRKAVALIALLGVGQSAAFEFHLSSWVNADDDPTRLPLLPEVEKLSWANTLCIYGESDTEANCAAFKPFGVNTIAMKGDHHFDEQYDRLVQYVIDNVKPGPRVNAR